MKKKIIKKTPLGTVVVIWSRRDGSLKIVHILLPMSTISAEARARKLYSSAKESSCKEVDALSANIKAFLNGKNVKFSLNILDWTQCTVFQKSVLRAEYKIPRGKVSTYQLIARHVGRARGARAVGNALASNPFPLIIPCHRAVASDRSLGGFQGGLSMKKALLENEGVVFDDKGRVRCARFHYQ